MSNGFQASQVPWRHLENEWQIAQAGWNDQTTRYFEAHYWTPLESQARLYDHALERLAQTLEAIQSVIAQANIPE